MYVSDPFRIMNMLYYKKHLTRVTVTLSMHTASLIHYCMLLLQRAMAEW